MMNSLKIFLLAITYFLLPGSSAFSMQIIQAKRFDALQASFYQEACQTPSIKEIFNGHSNQASIEALEACMEINYKVGRMQRIAQKTFLAEDAAILISFEELDDEKTITDLMKAARDGNLVTALQLLNSSEFNLGEELLKKDYLGRTVDYYTRSRFTDSRELLINKLAIRISIMEASIALCNNFASHYLSNLQ